MTVYRETLNVQTGTTEYYKKFDVLATSDEFELLFNNEVMIDDMVIKTVVSSGSRVYNVYLRYPVSQMELQITSSDVSDANDTHTWTMNQATNGRAWYRIPAGTKLVVKMGSVSNGTSIEICAIGR